jgi:hypothetical protein
MPPPVNPWFRVLTGGPESLDGERVDKGCCCAKLEDLGLVSRLRAGAFERVRPLTKPGLDATSPIEVNIQSGVLPTASGESNRTSLAVIVRGAPVPQHWRSPYIWHKPPPIGPARPTAPKLQLREAGARIPRAPSIGTSPGAFRSQVACLHQAILSAAQSSRNQATSTLCMSEDK